MEVFKSKHEATIETVDQILTGTAQMGITHLTTQDEYLDGRHIRINGKNVVNFGSCSYLGLEMDDRLKQGAIEAILRYGTQFSSSRAYMSVTPYKEAEGLLEKMFGRPVILTPTVTLGHASNIPVIVGDDDAVILDHQVHNSVLNACKDVKARGIRMETIRHSRMDLLEDRIINLQDKYKKIWYMADGVYSMYGDGAPISELNALMDKYENFYVYMDDAHGLGWAGPHGTGYATSFGQLHKQMYLVSGLAKSFGVSGGVLVFPDEESRRKVRNCGGPNTFSGPLQPASLGAIIASAKIHLSDEIESLQQELLKKIKFFNNTAKIYNLPLICPTESPIFFIGLSKMEVAHNLWNRLVKEGYYVNLSIYPSVSFNNAGMRIPITRHHTLEDIDGLLRAIAKHLPIALAEENFGIDEVYKAFRQPLPTGSNYLHIIREIKVPHLQYVALQ